MKISYIPILFKHNVYRNIIALPWQGTHDYSILFDDAVSMAAALTVTVENLKLTDGC